MKMTTCTVVVNWRGTAALAKLPERAAAGARRLGALTRCAARWHFGKSSYRYAPWQAGAPAQSSPARVVSDPGATFSSPGAEERAGAWWSPGRTPGSRGSPQVSTSPAPAPWEAGS